MNAKYLTLCLFGLLSFTQVNAQDTLGISKETVLKKVAEGNLEIKISQHDFKASQAEYRQSSAVFLPNITVSHTGISTTNPLMAFGSKLNQEILTQNDFNPSLLNNPDVTQNFATKIEVLQPILNFDGFAQRQAARIKSQSYKLQAERTQEAMLLDAKKSYMELQLNAWRDGSRDNDPQHLMLAVAERMSDKDIKAVAAWLAAQPASGAGTP